MATKPRWETRRVKCPEGEGTAELLVEWSEEGGQPVLRSVSCENPRLADIDNWDCKWSCWERLQAELSG
jgi:hypothetical protein